MSKNPIMKSIEEQGAFFDVHEEKVKTGSGKVVESRKVICRDDDGKPLGIVSTKYQTVTNREIFERFDDALQKSKIKLSGATAAVTFANEGARTMVHMRFPEHEIALDDDERSVLQIVAKNSYDGRWNFSTRGGALRMACLNGMLLGDWRAAYSEYHNSNLSVELAAQKVVQILGAFDGTKKVWQRMLKSRVTDEQAWRTFCLFSKRSGDFKRGIAAYRDATRSNAATKLMDHWTKTEKKDLGTNAFALYNALTHHATHAKLREGKEAIGLDLRMGEVERVLSSKYWNDRVLKAA